MVDVVNVQNNEQNYVFLVKIVNIMKQYTNKEQTQHLIEMGFPEPNSVSVTPKYYDDENEYDYSIGELIDKLYDACVELKEQGVI